MTEVQVAYVFRYGSISARVSFSITHIYIKFRKRFSSVRFRAWPRVGDEIMKHEKIIKETKIKKRERERVNPIYVRCMCIIIYLCCGHNGISRVLYTLYIYIRITMPHGDFEQFK